MTATELLAALHAHADPSQLANMAKFGMRGEKRLGIKVPVLRQLAKQAGKNHALALELWATGYSEARMVASMVAEPARLTSTQMEQWVKDFDAWDVCDQVCGNLFDKSPLAWGKVPLWAKRKAEYEKRAAFALLACLAWHDKTATDAAFIATLPLIEQAATDDRNFVKKAVNWALRNIGKRNRVLNRATIALATQLQVVDDKTARWIAADALRELQGEAVQSRLR